MNGYKRFYDLTIDLGNEPARIVALVGPNGCGKSSVLDGFVYHATSYSRVGIGSNRDHTYHSNNSAPSMNRQNVQIDFMDGTSPKTYKQMFEKKTQNEKENTIISFRSPYRYSENLKINETRKITSINSNDYGATDTSSIDSKIEINYRRLHADFNQKMRDDDIKPSEAYAQIVGKLNEHIRNCLDLEISSIGDVNNSRGTLYFKKTDHPQEFEFNVLSSGEKEVIDILLDLYLRQKDYDETIFLFDEPELHINASIQRKLLNSINKLVGENCQIWLTTHSIGFLRALQTEMQGDCQIIQFRPELELASKAHELRPIKTTHKVWRELFEVALDDLAALVSPKTIIYCEGRDQAGPRGDEPSYGGIWVTAVYLLRISLVQAACCDAGSINSTPLMNLTP